MPGNIGWQGLVVIVLVLLVVFGPKRLPELGRSLGRGMREFKDSVVRRPPPRATTSSRHRSTRSAARHTAEPDALPEAREHDKVV